MVREGLLAREANRVPDHYTIHPLVELSIRKRFQAAYHHGREVAEGEIPSPGVRRVDVPLSQELLHSEDNPRVGTPSSVSRPLASRNDPGPAEVREPTIGTLELSGRRV